MSEVRKICTKCGEEKDLDKFIKRKRTKSGYGSHCKVCENRMIHERKAKLTPEELEKRRIETRCRERERWKNRSKEQRERKLNNQRKRRKGLTESQLESRRKKNMERYYIKMKDEEWVLKRRESERVCNMDSFSVFRRNLRGLIKRINKGGKSTIEILGCSYDEALEYLESNNSYGSIKKHVDHIVPLSWAENEDEAIRLSHISNLQYLPEIDNLIKGDRMCVEYFTKDILDRFGEIIYRYITKTYYE